MRYASVCSGVEAASLAWECPDRHRYKACGNSMCVNVMRWIGKRIQQVEDRENE